MMRLGKWISNKTAKPFYARKEIELSGKVQKATAYVCGLGQFHFFVNGKKVGNHELDPGWTNYHKLVQYVTFDIKNDLTAGRNAVGVEVGNGWYHMDRQRYYMSMPPQSEAFSFMPPNANPYHAFSDYLALNCRIEIEYADGTKEVVISDDSWKTHPHYVTLANVFGSEILDGRMREDDFTSPCYDDAGWVNAELLENRDVPKGRFINQYQPPITVKYVYDARFIRHIDHHSIFDLGQNMSGIIEFEVKGKRGDVINLYPAEKLDPYGDIDQMAKGWTKIDVCVTYIIGQDDVWENCRMKFTYVGCRYIAVEGAVRESDQHTSGLPLIRRLRGNYITSSCEKTGEFKSDDVKLEQIYDMVLRSVESNPLSVHTDCPTIERYAWQETNHLMAPSIMYMKNVRSLWDKILLDMRVDQLGKDDFFYGSQGEKIFLGEGLFPSQAPMYEVNSVQDTQGTGNFFDTIAWGSAEIIAAYWHYIFYADEKIIEDNYFSGMKYLNYLKSKVTQEGFISHGLGDWGTPDQKDLSRENVETAFFYADAVILSEFAEILGRHEEKKNFDNLAIKIKDHYNEKLLVRHPSENNWCYRSWNSANEFYTNQVCQALPLYWGMVPEDKRNDVEKALVREVQKKGAFCCGEVGLTYIIQMLSQCGMHDTIMDCILRKEHPGYYAFILDGETTLGEKWETNPRSHNHDMLGHIVEWYYNGIAGIKPLKPGFQEVLIQPYLPKTAGSFQCKFMSVNGRIEVRVRELSDKILVNLKVPSNIRFVFDDSYLKIRGKRVELQTISDSEKSNRKRYWTGRVIIPEKRRNFIS